jgi:hypothetical protein
MAFVRNLWAGLAGGRVDDHEQRFVIKFLWIQGHSSKAIHAQLQNILRACAGSLWTVKRLLTHFRAGDPSRESLWRSEMQLAVLRDVSSKFFAKCHFAFPTVIARHSFLSSATVKESLIRELGLRKPTRRSVSDFLSEALRHSRPPHS